MPPYDNRMSVGMPQPPGGMGPGGQMQVPQMDPAMITQLMQRYAQMQGGQSAPFSQMGPGMQNMSPDQGMNQAPGNMGVPGGGGFPMPKPMMNPGGGNMEGRAGMGGMPGSYPGGSGPFMPPGMEPGQGQMMQKPMARPPWLGGNPGTPPMQGRPEAPSGPPPMRMPPGAGVWKNPASGQMMNQTPSFSGARNPADVKRDAPGPGATPQPGGVMNAPPDDVSPIRMAGNPMVANSDKIRPKQQGAPPFNPNAGGVTAQAPTEPGMVNKPWGNETQKRQGLARAMTSRVTKSAVK